MDLRLGPERATALHVMSGAGISAGSPASLPLGDEFHRLLVDAYLTATERVAPGMLTPRARAAIAHGRWDLIARLYGCMGEAATGVVACFAVAVPSEAHLLAALHLATGGMHVTLNFDDGIERAYALLRGDCELPVEAGPAYHAALGVWRGAFPRDAPPLHVVAAVTDLEPARLGRRPLLVKLRGSTRPGAGGMLRPAALVIDEAESVQLDAARLVVLDALTAGRFLLITGCSGSDIDCFEALVARLRHGVFAWVAREIRPSVARRLSGIDPCQPIHGMAADALRACLPYAPPPWPRQPLAQAGFADRFAAWWRTLDPLAVAEACAWMLTDAEHHDEAAALLLRLREVSANPRLELRLADALLARGGPEGQDDADRRYLSVARSRRVPPPLRAYALTRWSGVGTRPSELFGESSTRLGALALAWVLTLGQGRWSASRAKIIEGFAEMVLESLRPWLGLPGSWTQRIPQRTLTRCTAALIRWVLRSGGDAIGVGRGRVALHRQLTELEGARALLSKRPMADDTLRRLAWVEHVCAHFADPQGMRAARNVRRLLACLDYSPGFPAAARRDASDSEISRTVSGSGNRTTECQGSSSITTSRVIPAPRRPPAIAATVSVSPPKPIARRSEPRSDVEPTTQDRAAATVS